MISRGTRIRGRRDTGLRTPIGASTSNWMALAAAQTTPDRSEKVRWTAGRRRGRRAHASVRPGR